MNKIKTAIIHWLGGVTAQELKDAKISCFKRGYRIEATAIQCEMRDLNGLSAEEWCDAMWKYVAERVERYNKRYDEE
jgi:hypothetical protein